jgi:GT2 family glycosyltransferase
MGQRSTYGAGIVHFGSDPGLAACLASLRDQIERPAVVVVIDHDPPDPADARRAALKAAHPDVEWVHAPNGGYAGGANRATARILANAPGVEFLLLLNPDVALEPAFASTLLDALEPRPEVALASGKLLRPGGERIDSAGIERRRCRRYRDRGSEAPDDGRHDVVESVFALSGAALFLRRSALSSLCIEGELFDEDFFTYHEDTDLAWRAARLGWDRLYVPAARAIHVRGWRRGERRGRPEGIRRHSFKNRYLELIKNEHPLAFLRDLPFILPVEAARLAFALVFERAMLGAYRDALRLAGRAYRKRRVLRRMPGRTAVSGAISPAVGARATKSAPLGSGLESGLAPVVAPAMQAGVRLAEGS